MNASAWLISWFNRRRRHRAAIPGSLLPPPLLVAVDYTLVDRVPAANDPRLSQEESAKRLGVDPSTLARWERGEREPAGVFLDRVERFLDGRE